jgi:hypothetical protein
MSWRAKRRAATVEEDEQLASFAAALRHDEDLVQVRCARRLWSVKRSTRVPRALR